MPLSPFCARNGLVLERPLARGWSATVHLVRHAKSGRLLALKCVREKSPRKDLCAREVTHLSLANTLGIGPLLYAYDPQEQIVLMEYVEGATLPLWLDTNPSPVRLQNTLSLLMAQARALDGAGLSHGQLAGRGKNILVRKSGEPVIIDFEKASAKRRARNAFQLESLLFRNPRGALAQKVRGTLGISFDAGLA